MRAVGVHKYGGPEVLTNEDIPVLEPKAGEARVKIEAIGVNFIDFYQRTGLYPLQTPFTLGMEGAGIVDALGDNVTEVKVGDRVAYAMILGSYAEYAIVPAAKLAPTIYFNWTARGKLKVRIESNLPLAEAAEAHRLLEGRKTTGKMVLFP
jgi:NADPH2:quinone reductase